MKIHQLDKVFVATDIIRIEHKELKKRTKLLPKIVVQAHVGGTEALQGLRRGHPLPVDLLAQQVLHCYLGLQVFFPDPQGERAARAQPPHDAQPLPGGSVQRARARQGCLLSKPWPPEPRVLDSFYMDLSLSLTTRVALESLLLAGAGLPTIALLGHGHSPQTCEPWRTSVLSVSPVVGCWDPGCVLYAV